MCRFKPKAMETSYIMLKYPYSKWIVLVVCCVLVFTNTYCNNLVSLQTPLLDQYHLSNLQYNILFSVYSMPNIVLPILGGILIDKIDPESCLILFISLEWIGQFLFALGLTSFNYYLMIIGRVFYGLGGECVHVATYALIGIYFDGSYVAFAMGIRQSMARFGSSANVYFTDIVLTKTQCISCTVWIGFFLLFLALIIAVLLCILMKYFNNKIFIIRQQYHKPHIIHSTSLLSQTPNYAPNAMRVEHSISNRDHSITHSSTIPINYGAVSSSLRRRSSFRFRDIHDFNSVYWLLNICCSLMYSCTVSWNNIAQNQFENDFKLQYSSTDKLLTIFFIITGICGPFFGFIADKIGKKCQLIIGCGCLLLISHILMYSFNDIKHLYPVYIVVILAIGFSVFPAAIFPGIAMIVRKKTYGTAYGLITATFNTTLTVVPIIIAILTTTNYKDVEIFFITMASLSILIGVLLIYYDNKYGSKLSISTIKWRKTNIDTSTS